MYKWIATESEFLPKSELFDKIWANLLTAVTMFGLASPNFIIKTFIVNSLLTTFIWSEPITSVLQKVLTTYWSFIIIHYSSKLTYTFCGWSYFVGNIHTRRIIHTIVTQTGTGKSKKTTTILLHFIIIIILHLFFCHMYNVYRNKNIEDM